MKSSRSRRRLHNHLTGLRRPQDACLFVISDLSLRCRQCLSRHPRGDAGRHDSQHPGRAGSCKQFEVVLSQMASVRFCGSTGSTKRSPPKRMPGPCCCTQTAKKSAELIHLPRDRGPEPELTVFFVSFMEGLCVEGLLQLRSEMDFWPGWEDESKPRRERSCCGARQSSVRVRDT